MIIINKGKIGDKEYLNFTTNHKLEIECKQLKELDEDISFSGALGHSCPMNIILEDISTDSNPIINIRSILYYLEEGLAMEIKYVKWEQQIRDYIDDINQAITDEDAISFSYLDCKILKEILEEEQVRLSHTKALTGEDLLKGKSRTYLISEFIKEFNKI